MPSVRRARKGTPAPRVLTDADWHRLEPLLRNIDPRRRQAAYSRLVLGSTLVEAGAVHGYSKQDVSMIVKAVLRWWERLQGIPEDAEAPPGWVAVRFFVPAGRVDDIRRVVDALCAPDNTSKTK
jgi:transposase